MGIIEEEKQTTPPPAGVVAGGAVAIGYAAYPGGAWRRRWLVDYGALAAPPGGARRRWCHWRREARLDSSPAGPLCVWGQALFLN